MSASHSSDALDEVVIRLPGSGADVTVRLVVEVVPAPLVAPATTRAAPNLRVVPDPAPPPAAASLDRLSAREEEVLLLLAEGLSNGEIAGRLYVSEATVKTHVAHVLAKLEVRDRVQAVVAAFLGGLAAGPGASRLGP